MSNLIRNCHRCGKDFSAPYKERLCEDCLKELGWESTPQTNADHIRSMTDEELATELLPLFEELCEDGIPSPEYMRFWLKQPYKEEA